MKNTPENKAKFFAQYWGQKILKFKYENGEVADGKDFVSEFSLQDIEDYPDWHLELKPLSQITDEDVVKVMESIGFSGNNYTYRELLSVGKPLIKGIQIWTDKTFPISKIIRAVDVLRGFGFAVDWNGISVEEQIEFGWVKLKN